MLQESAVLTPRQLHGPVQGMKLLPLLLTGLSLSLACKGKEAPPSATNSAEQAAPPAQASPTKDPATEESKPAPAASNLNVVAFTVAMDAKGKKAALKVNEKGEVTFEGDGAPEGVAMTINASGTLSGKDGKEIMSIDAEGAVTLADGEGAWTIAEDGAVLSEAG